MVRPTQNPYSLREALRPFGRRFAWVGLYFLLLFTGGTLGYVLIEDWPWFDGLYMAVTTATSLGIMEVHPLSSGGRVFTMFVLILGITGLGVWWGLITALIVELDLGGIFRRRRMLRAIEGLSQHFIIGGAGRIGRVVVREMMDAGVSFVVIEQDGTKLDALREEFPRLLCLQGDATKSHTLELARVDTASGLAACLGEDADNILLCLTGRGLRPDLRIVSRAYDEESLDKMARAGADHAISPNVTGGVRLASVLLRPNVVNYLDVVTRGAGLSLRLEEAAIPAGSALAGRTLSEARIPQQTGLVVLAHRSGGVGAITHNPGPDTRLQAGDVMVVVGEEAQIRKLRAYVEKGPAR